MSSIKYDFGNSSEALNVFVSPSKKLVFAQKGEPNEYVPGSLRLVRVDGSKAATVKALLKKNEDLLTAVVESQDYQPLLELRQVLGNELRK